MAFAKLKVTTPDDGLLKAGSLWTRPDDHQGIVYLLTQMGDSKWVLVSMNKSGNTWSGLYQATVTGSTLSQEGWRKMRTGHEFEFISWMPNIYAKDLMVPHWEDECRDLMWRNRKVQAIQVMRKATGRGLKDSKDYCEANFPMEDTMVPF